MTTAGPALVSTRAVTIRFGGHVAVDHVTLDVEPFTLKSIIGPNGAGKTTFFDLLNDQYMLDVLLMVIIGGIGTRYGGLIGAAFLLTARTLLPDLKVWSPTLLPGSAILQRLAERWLLYFGILFILVVFFFPEGVVGTLRERLARAPARAAVGGRQQI